LSNSANLKMDNKDLGNFSIISDRGPQHMSYKFTGRECLKVIYVNLVTSPQASDKVENVDGISIQGFYHVNAHEETNVHIFLSLETTASQHTYA
jgi:hypothetical protein